GGAAGEPGALPRRQPLERPQHAPPRRPSGGGRQLGRLRRRQTAARAGGYPGVSGGRQLRVLHVVAMQVRWLCFEWLCEERDRERFHLSFLLVTAGEPP